MLSRLIQAIRRNPDPWIIVAAIDLAVLLRLPTLGQPLLEAHEFRQTQTAYTALLFHEQGIDLFHSQLPVLGPPYEVPFEFPLFQALASLLMDAGIPADPAMRVTCLGFFVLTGVLTWGLVRHVAGRGAAIGALLFFLFSPFSFLWGRSSMIEYLATAAAVGAVWAGVTWRDQPRWWLWGVVLGAGVIGMTVKLPTTIFWLVPLLLYRAAHDAPGMAGWVRARLDPRFLGMLGLPIAAGIAWTVHADAIKGATPATAWMTSRAQVAWNFGTIDQRKDLRTWLDIGKRVGPYVFGLPFLALIPFSIWAAIRSRQFLFWVGIVLAGFLPILVFYNLYWIHDYYLAAVSPAIAAVLGLGAARLLAVLRRRWLQVGAVAVLLGAWLFTMWVTQDYWKKVYEPINDAWGVLGMADELVAATNPGDEVVVSWKDWSPSILYYSRMRGMMLPPDIRNDPLMNHLDDGPYSIFFATDPQRWPIWPLRDWPWIGVLGPRIYAVGESPEDLREAAIMATDDEVAWTEAATVGAPITAPPLELRCDGQAPYEVPSGEAGTWLHFGPDPPKEARIDFGLGLAPVPVRSYVFVDATLTAGDPLVITCLGDKTGRASFLGAFDAPAPR